MTIGMLLNAPYPSDVRVKKETDALIAAGFNVCLLCLGKSGQKKEENINGLTVQRINAGEGNNQLALWDIIMSVTFIHPVFRKAIPNWIKENSISAIHVHDLPLVGTAFSIRKKFKVPVIADFHENYPDALRTWFTWKKNPFAQLKNKLFLNPEHWATFEKKAALESDHVIAVVDEMKQRLSADYGISPEKVTVISNTEDKSFLQQPQDSTIYKDYPDKFIITYSGNIGPHRGVDTVIEAMAHLKQYPEIVFVIVGLGSDSVMKMLKKMTIEQGVDTQVFFLGRQPFDKFYSYMKYTDVNIIPHKSNRHTDNTVPHKLFQAMMTGKPLIVSSSAPLKRIVSTISSGLIFEAGNPSDLARKIIDLYENKSIRQQLGENGIIATLQGTWNWEHEQKKLIKLYSSIQNAKS